MIGYSTLEEIIQNWIHGHYETEIRVMRFSNNVTRYQYNTKDGPKTISLLTIISSDKKVTAFTIDPVTFATSTDNEEESFGAYITITKDNEMIVKDSLPEKFYTLTGMIKHRIDTLKELQEQHVSENFISEETRKHIKEEG